MKPVRSIHLVGDAVWFCKADYTGYRVYLNVSQDSRQRVAQFCNGHRWTTVLFGNGWIAWPPRNT